MQPLRTWIENGVVGDGNLPSRLSVRLYFPYVLKANKENKKHGQPMEGDTFRCGADRGFYP